MQGLPEVGTVVAEDVMDDGSPIRLSVTIDRRDGTAIFDFEGTGTYHYMYPKHVHITGTYHYMYPKHVSSDDRINEGEINVDGFYVCVCLRLLNIQKTFLSRAVNAHSDVLNKHDDRTVWISSSLQSSKGSL
jgi:hypothetical protein